MASRLLPNSWAVAVLHSPSSPGSLGPCQPGVTPSRAFPMPHLDLVTQLQLTALASARPLQSSSLCELPMETQCPGRNKLGPHSLVTLALQWPCLSDDRGNPSSKLTSNMKQAAAFTGEPAQCPAPH